MIDASISKMFQDVFNLDYKKMVINKKYDVTGYNCAVKSWNTNKNRKEYCKVLNVVRKEDSVCYIVTTITGRTVKTSANHRFFVKLYSNKEPYFEEICVLKERNKPFYLMSEMGWEGVEKVEIVGTTPILDMEVEGNHNYFSNGVLSHNTIFGNPETTSGGNALKFYASQRLEVRRKADATLKDSNGDLMGHIFKVKVVKNKVAPPFRTAECTLIYGEGVSRKEEIMELATDFEILKKSGSWYAYEDAKIAQGKANLRQFLEDNPEVLTELEVKVKEKLKEDA